MAMTKMLLHLFTIWTLICAALAHPGGKGKDHDHDDNYYPVCPPPYHPTKTITTALTTKITASCTFTGTQTFYATRGCNGLTCETGFCITDAPATKSCGCSSLEFVTKTITVCPTTTPCWQCTTGWGSFIYIQPCMTGSSSTTSSPTCTTKTKSKNKTKTKPSRTYPV